MKILISSCVYGNAVRWNGSSKLNESIKQWANVHGFELIPICPENDLFGTPRKPIRLTYEDNEVKGMMGDKNVYPALNEKCKQILRKYSDAVGYIGIAGSRSCGISVGVRNLGKTQKAPMHIHATFPTTEINSLKTAKNRMMFLDRIVKYITFGSRQRLSRKVDAQD